MSELTIEEQCVVVDYEIMMFLRARIGAPLPNNDAFLRNYVSNALLESRVLHIRALTEVFIDSRHDDDIKATEILEEWCGPNKKLVVDLFSAYTTINLKLGASPLTTINKHLAHTTKKRGKSFDWFPVIETMEPTLLNILRTLPIEKFPNLVLLNQPRFLAPV